MAGKSQQDVLWAEDLGDVVAVPLQAASQDPYRPPAVIAREFNVCTHISIIDSIYFLVESSLLRGLAAGADAARSAPERLLMIVPPSVLAQPPPSVCLC